jgi:hypothetical protein
MKREEWIGREWKKEEEKKTEGETDLKIKDEGGHDRGR